MLRRATVFFVHQRHNAMKYAPYEPVEGNSIVFLDLTTEMRSIGRVTIELFNDVVPRTAENFRSLCTGERGRSELGVNLWYRGVPFHRIVPNFCAMGGDVRFRDGRGTESVFGYPFNDESFEGKAGKNICGTVAMSNNGPHRNGSQFFFNLADSQHLNGKFVVVGQVLAGWDHVVAISQMGARCGTPTRKVWVADCGQTSGAKMEQFEEIPTDSLHANLPGEEVLNMLRPRGGEKQLWGPMKPGSGSR